MLQPWMFLLALGLVSTPALAGDPTTSLPKAQLTVAENQPIAIGDEIRLRSAILGSEVTMRVSLPSTFDVASKDHTYPVVLAIGSHGTRFFPTLAGIVRHLGDRERMPEAIVVSLEDSAAMPDVYTHGMWGTEEIEGWGDPVASLRHLREEVFPYLESHYRANDWRMIVGVSGSALFPIYTFTHAPDLFRSHVLVAAADMLGMGPSPEETFIDEFADALRRAPERTGALYVGVAAADFVHDDRYQGNLDELERRLAPFDGFDVEVEVFPREDHYAAFVPALRSALDQSFPWERWSARYRELVAQPGNALANIDRYYRELSRHYGFEILPRADRWNNVNCLRFVTVHLIREDRTAEAVEVAERRVSYHPGSSAALEGLVDAYEADGRIEDAISVLARRIAQAREEAEPDLASFRSRMDQLNARRPATVP